MPDEGTIRSEEVTTGSEETRLLGKVSDCVSINPAQVNVLNGLASLMSVSLLSLSY